MKIFFISPEVAPFAKTGGLADVSGILPGTLNTLGYKCSIIMPLYSLVKKNGFNPTLFKSDVSVNLGDEKYKFNIRHLEHVGHRKTDVYFIENDQFYARPQLYGTPQGDYPDNALRFAFFAKAAISIIEHAGGADIVHCNDWQSALTPLYLKLYPHKNITKKPGIVFTIHNMAYQGLFDPSIINELDIPEAIFTPDGLEFYGKLSFMKAGIIYSDAITTVSKGYAREILTPEFGCGLDGLLRTRANSLYGIVNGVNYDEWNPKVDEHIAVRYDEKNIDKKADCKKDLLKAFGLKQDIKKPVLGVVTRLAEQKGIDLIADNTENILSLGGYLVLLGTGDERYNNLFKEIAAKYEDSIGVKIAFDNTVAHKIEAGSDMFLMPSRYEPCGLNQMYSLKYGTVPIVRATGGLDDTIDDFNPTTEEGNGFKFKDASAEGLYSAIKRAIDIYNDKKKWRILQENAMRCDFSWKRSADEYADLYKNILS